MELRMQKIEAIIRPDKLTDVLTALDKKGCSGVMVTEIQGHGKQKGIVQQWQENKVRVSLLSKVKIEIITQDADVEAITDTIAEIAKTREIGDGKIFISPIANVIRIRTGEQGNIAL